MGMVDLDALKDVALEKLALAQDETSLEAERIALLGKKGLISQQLKQLSGLSAEERQTYGAALNQLKNLVAEKITAKKREFQEEGLRRRLEAETVDVTLPVGQMPISAGRIHPLTQVTEEMVQILSAMGFSVASGPDIETDYYNFTALNFPEGHPARDMHDTFFFQPREGEEQKLLRTHTSAVQIRTMQKQEPPIRVIMAGKTYRVDSDATHSPMFHQLEGLFIDKTANFAQLKGLLEEFCKSFFEVKNLKMRFRPSFFPFTEPSMEVDIQCKRSSGGSIRIGEGDDWLEVLGCGMVHPNVLRHGGVDSDLYQGFAWGMGIDRFAMLKYGMPDLRAFFNADVRWLKHYGFRPLDLPALMLGANTK